MAQQCSPCAVAVLLGIATAIGATPTHAQSIAGAVMGSPLGSVNATGEDGFYEAPSGHVVAVGGQLSFGCAIMDAIDVSVLAAFTHTFEPGGPIRVNTLALPVEGAFRVSRWDSFALWVPFERAMC